ncbi:MAG: TlpA family protein disulfide reductase [Myroides sp.]|nr:TlpA family protein disulfide reductase [Myroides sp.]
MNKLILTLLTISLITVGCDTKKADHKLATEINELKDSLHIQEDTTAQREAFNEVTLNKEFENVAGDKVSFENLIAKHHGKPIVIDVWASWCPDCIKGFPALKKLQQQYPETVYVFLSLDKTKDKWIEAIDKYELQGEHYYLNEKMKDEFGQSIQLDWIPRYIVVDSQGKIALKKAIVADDPILIDILDKLQP